MFALKRVLIPGRALSLPHPPSLFLCAAQQRRWVSSAAASQQKKAFRAQNDGEGQFGGRDANPFKSWEHLSHKWMILACLSCLAAGYLAGYLVDVDETLLKPRFKKDDVIKDAVKQFEFRPDLAATCLRVVFLLAARRAGFTADTTDESCAVVAGLSDVAGVMNFLSTTHNATTEDAASLAAVAALKYLKGPYEEVLQAWRWGRNDTDVAPARNVPKDPSKKVFSIPTILHGLGDLTDEECVALMACHSVGEYHDNVSGIDGATHIGKKYTLSNDYYKFLLETEKKWKPYEVQRTEDNKDVKILPQTMLCTYTTSKTRGKKKKLCVMNKAEVDTMLKSETWRPIVQKFAVDEEAWRRSFESGFTKLLDSHFRRLRVYSNPDL